MQSHVKFEAYESRDGVYSSDQLVMQPVSEERLAEIRKANTDPLAAATEEWIASDPAGYEKWLVDKHAPCDPKVKALAKPEAVANTRTYISTSKAVYDEDGRYLRHVTISEGLGKSVYGWRDEAWGDWHASETQGPASYIVQDDIADTTNWLRRDDAEQDALGRVGETYRNVRVPTGRYTFTPGDPFFLTPITTWKTEGVQVGKGDINSKVLHRWNRPQDDLLVLDIIAEKGLQVWNVEVLTAYRRMQLHVVAKAYFGTAKYLDRDIVLAWDRLPNGKFTPKTKMKVGAWIESRVAEKGGSTLSGYLSCIRTLQRKLEGKNSRTPFARNLPILSDEAVRAVVDEAISYLPWMTVDPA